MVSNQMSQNRLTFKGEFEINAARARSSPFQAVMTAAIIGTKAGDEGQVGPDGCGGTKIIAPDARDNSIIEALKEKERFIPNWRDMIDYRCGGKRKSI